MNATFKLLIAVFAAIFISACSTQSEVDESSADPIVIEDPDAGSGGVDMGDTTVTAVTADPEEGLESVFYFDFDKSSLTAETRAALDAYAAVLRANPRNFRLEGHGDERGTREYNIALGERRAKSVADYLISSGVSSGLIETVSYGEERPAVPGTGESAWSKNRRVKLN